MLGPLEVKAEGKAGSQGSGLHPKCELNDAHLGDNLFNDLRSLGAQ